MQTGYPMPQCILSKWFVICHLPDKIFVSRRSTWLKESVSQSVHIFDLCSVLVLFSQTEAS